LNVKKTSSEEILKEELQTFNWNELDTYPTFSSCDSVSSKTEKKVCFESVLTNHLSNYLAEQNFVVSNDVEDTLELTFIISEVGKASITDIKIKEETVSELPNIKSILQKSIDSLPQIFPAVKRGQQVTSQFKLPIVISVN
jgi:hypothetical protein